jgi:Na+/H+-dicarboxylate symporter
VAPIVAALSKLSNPNMLAFMTNNPIVALPATLDTLEKDYGVDRRVPDLVIPFGIFANQHGAVFLLSFLTVFLAQIYVIDLGFQDYAVIAIGSIIAGATAVGGGAVLIPTWHRSSRPLASRCPWRSWCLRPRTTSSARCARC